MLSGPGQFKKMTSFKQEAQLMNAVASNYINSAFLLFQAPVKVKLFENKFCLNKLCTEAVMSANVIDTPWIKDIQYNTIQFPNLLC